MRIPLPLARALTWCLRLGLVAALVWVLIVATLPDERAARLPIKIPPRLYPDDIVSGKGPIDDGGFSIACQFTTPIHDPKSLTELRDAIEHRGELGLAVLQAVFDHARLRFKPPKGEVAAHAQLMQDMSLLNLYEGRYSEAAAWLQKALALGRPRDIPGRDMAWRKALLGIAALRQGEVENSPAGLDPSSGSVPLDPSSGSVPLDSSTGSSPIPREVIQKEQLHTREAVTRFKAYLEEWPYDLRVRWLLNIAYMRLGEYPDKVPSEYLIPPARLDSKGGVGGFENLARAAGLQARGPNLAGGSLFDDFNGDLLPDLLFATLDVDRGASLFINRGDGTFQNRSSDAGLAEQVYVLNAACADFDNDGDLDVLLVRGGWEAPLRLSLLRNKGDGTFLDVTVAAGLAEPIASGSAAWGDYDNDGWVDLFVCGEYASASETPASAQPDARNRCRLYRNRGDGTFVDRAAAAGVVNERCAKGSAWGDYDDDGRPDLYVSNRNAPSRLYHNEGDGTFRDVAPALGVTGPPSGSACWFWDYDNDGRLDLFVSDNQADLAEIAAAALGLATPRPSRPRLYRNVGTDGFRDVATLVGLDRPLAPQGCNFGDVDGDGYLDIYIGNGWRSYASLVPSVMLRNRAGRRFEDVTVSSGTGRLQKAQSVSFADWDCDGDLDFFVQAGGAVPGDRAHNLLFKNPGHGRHWLKVKLKGTKTNRAALGAKIRVDFKPEGGAVRAIYRTVGNNSSAGGNSLIESIGLDSASRLERLTVSWPTSRTTQSFRDFPVDQWIEITEGAAGYRVLKPRPKFGKPL
jgi:hypothetical protein